MSLTVEVERETDGRWLAEVPELSGVMAYGQTREEAVVRAEALALRVLADRLERSEKVPDLAQVFAVTGGASRGTKLTVAELMRGVTDENIHSEIDFGPPVGREEW